MPAILLCMYIGLYHALFTPWGVNDTRLLQNSEPIRLPNYIKHQDHALKTNIIQFISQTNSTLQLSVVCIQVQHQENDQLQNTQLSRHC